MPRAHEIRPLDEWPADPAPTTRALLARDGTVVAVAGAALAAELVLSTALGGDPLLIAGHVGVVAVVIAALVIVTARAARQRTLAERRRKQMARTSAIVERKVRERTMRLEDELEQYRAIVENADAVAFEYDTVKHRVMYVAPQAARLLDCEAADLERADFLQSRVFPEDRAIVDAAIKRVHEHGSDGEPLDCRIVTARGRVQYVRTFLNGRAGSRRIRGFIVDMTRQRQLERELQQSQKLESVGRLAAGVAHEINTPIQFVGDSVEFVRGAIDDLAVIVAHQRAAVRAVLDGMPSRELAEAAARAIADADLPYLLEHLPSSLDRAREGVERVASIVRSMRVFAHPDKPMMGAVDVNQAIENTLTLARNEYRYLADVVTELGAVPQVWCHAGDLNQVILNILINAAHAIEETGSRGTITVRSFRAETNVIIAITDTGGGIPDHVRDHIFEPFFTTKDVGKGTGQGLAIARSVIVDRYRGSLAFETTTGVGTTFKIMLPAHAAQLEVAA